MKKTTVRTPASRRGLCIFAVAVMLSMIPLPGRAQDSETIDRIVAEVNDGVITLFELNQAAQPFIERVRGMNRPLEEERRMLFEVREKVLNQLIDQMLTDQEIERLQISVSEETVDNTIEQIKKSNFITDAQLREKLKVEGLTMEDYRKQVRDQILRGRLVNREVKSKIVITDEDIQACYIENKDQYCGEKKYHIRHILMKVPSFANDDEKAAVRRRMEAVMERLEAGESFADLASTYTESPLRDEGGDLGAFELKGLSPPIRKAVENLQAGAHSGIVDTDQGLQIFYLEEVIEQPDQPIEEVRAEIETRLYNQIVDEKFESWLAELRRKSHIRIIR